MRQTGPEGGKAVDRRRKIQTIGQLRHEKMVVMNTGERRAPDEGQLGQQLGMAAKKSASEPK